ncbi:MAG: (2Fe-2S) ferredoxin domain-containing protein [Treponemataceae bacterium]
MNKTKQKIQICMGSSCFSRGNGLNAELLHRLITGGTLDARLDETGMDGIEIAGSLCAGLCKDGPIIVVDGVVHKQVTPMTLQDILATRFGISAESER